MPAINPEITSRLARDIYQLSSLSSLAKATLSLNSMFEGQFEFAESAALHAKTGPIGIKISSAFGFVLYGKGKFEGHAVIIFRGSVSAADWLSNVNTLTTTTSSGYSVHKGFKDAFDSMKGPIGNFLNDVSRKGKKKIHSVHCVGHRNKTAHP